MNRSQVNRSVIAARAGVSVPNRGARPSTDLLQRELTRVSAAGPVRRTTCAPMTKAQRDSEGRYSDWNRPTDYFTDPAWSRTVSEGARP